MEQEVAFDLHCRSCQAGVVVTPANTVFHHFTEEPWFGYLEFYCACQRLTRYQWGCEPPARLYEIGVVDSQAYADCDAVVLYEQTRGEVTIRVRPLSGDDELDLWEFGRALEGDLWAQLEIGNNHG